MALDPWAAQSAGAGIVCSPVVPSSFYLQHVKLGPPVLLFFATAVSPLLPHWVGHTSSSLPWLPVSTPPTCLDECFFIKSLVVGCPGLCGSVD